MSDNRLAVPSNYTWIAGAEKVDDLHVRLKLKRVFPAALEYVAMVLPIYPESCIARRRVRQFSTKPIGTGPYHDYDGGGRTDSEISLRTQRRRISMGPKGKPVIKNLVIEEVGDPSGELDRLLSGRADWVWNISADQLPKLAAMPAIQTATSESMRVAYMNMDSPPGGAARTIR